MSSDSAAERRRSPGRLLEWWRYECNFPEPLWAQNQHNALCCLKPDWSKLYTSCFRDAFWCPPSTLLHPVLASSFPLDRNFSERGSYATIFPRVGPSKNCAIIFLHQITTLPQASRGWGGERERAWRIHSECVLRIGSYRVIEITFLTQPACF